MVEYLCHHLPTAQVFWDDGVNPMATFFDCLTASEEGAFHFEDDATLSYDFLSDAQSIIGNGLTPVQFFSRTKDDSTKGTRFRPGSSWMYNVGFWLPPGMGREIVAFHPSWKDRDVHRTGFDLLIAAYLQKAKVRYLNVVPSLVQHTPLTSTLGKRSTARQSPLFSNPVLEHHPYPELLQASSV